MLRTAEMKEAVEKFFQGKGKTVEIKTEPSDVYGEPEFHFNLTDEIHGDSEKYMSFCFQGTHYARSPMNSTQTPVPVADENRYEITGEIFYRKFDYEKKHLEYVNSESDMAELLEKYIHFTDVTYVTTDQIKQEIEKYLDQNGIAERRFQKVTKAENVVGELIYLFLIPPGVFNMKKPHEFLFFHGKFTTETILYHDGGRVHKEDSLPAISWTMESSNDGDGRIRSIEDVQEFLKKILPLKKPDPTVRALERLVDLVEKILEKIEQLEAKTPKV